MKVDKTTNLTVTLGAVLIEWDSKRPTEFNLSIDKGGDDRLLTVDGNVIAQLKEVCSRILIEAEAAQQKPAPTPKRSTTT